MVVIFIKGNPYLVPYGSKTGYINELAAKTFHEVIDVFHECKEGDIWWAEPTTHSKIFPPSRNINGAVLHNAVKNGLYRCTSKMSDKEYNYYLQRESQNRQFAHDKNMKARDSFDNTLNQMNYNNQQQMNRDTINNLYY